jgi:anti-sigma regulatory factor (Ser/Thr protein kinase)
VAVVLDLFGVHQHVALGDPTDVATARRRAVKAGEAAGLADAAVAELALVVTEMATNVLKHGGGGGILVGATTGGAPAVALVAWDRGPGMDLAQCLPDGMSTTGTPGHGLGAIARVAAAWDVFSVHGGGTIATAIVGATPRPAGRFAIAGVCVPLRGEDACGDAWDAEATDDVATVIAVDGLGHGPLASDAARAVIAAFRDDPGASPARVLERAHLAARSTRGAAASVARIDRDARTVTFAGVGNVSGWLRSVDAGRTMVGQHGTLGATIPRIREETYALAPDASVILASDGLRTDRSANGHGPLLHHPPLTVAAVLWRDLARGTDDVVVVVARPEVGR